MNNLFAFGCSLTYGQSLPDCWISKKLPYTASPSKLAWPQLLADKLSLNCVNLSLPGASNKQILFELEKNIDNISNNDIVFIKWSFHDRWGILDLDHHNKWRRVIQPQKEWYKWVKMFFTNEDAYWMSSIFIDYASFLLKNKNIKHFYLYTDKDLPTELYCKYSNFVEDGSINLIRYNYKPALDNSHPGLEAHAKFADLVYQKTKDYINETALQ